MLDAPKEDDETRTAEGLHFYIQKDLVPYIGSIYLDYEKSFWGEGVTIRSARGLTC